VIRGLRFLAIDEGRQQLSLVDTHRPGSGWVLNLTDLPLARDLQRLGPDSALVGFDRGYFEVEVSSGRVTTVVDRWKQVAGARRLASGSTLVTGVGLGGHPGVTVLTVAPGGEVTHTAVREGDYVRLMRPTPSGTYLLATNDHILETDPELVEIRRFAVPGFLHAWLAHRYADGSTLVTAGYGAFLARFDAQGRWERNFGATADVPPEVEPSFYATVQVWDDRLLVANWQGHGPDNGTKGRQLLEFSSDGSYVDSWSDQDHISSLQGILALDWNL